MAATCTGTPTETQFSGSEVTVSTSESLSIRTEFTTITLSSTSEASPTITDIPLPELSIITNLITETVFIPIVETSLIPVLTLFAPCESETSSTPSSSSPTSSSTRTSGPSSPSATPSGSSQSGSLPGSDDDGDKSLPPTGTVNTLTSSGMTIVVSELITTNEDGVLTTFVTPIQTLLNTPVPLSPSARAGIISGAILGGVAILVALLTLLFFLRRQRQARKRLNALRDEKMVKPRRLIEDDDDDFDLAAPMREWDNYSLASSTSGAPRLLRARNSNGSIFHENVYPPPSNPIQDPLLDTTDLSSTVSLVMGPPPPGSAMAISTDSVPMGAGRKPVTYGPSSSTTSSLYSYNPGDPFAAHTRAQSTDPLLPGAFPRSDSPSSVRTADGRIPPSAYRANPAALAKAREARGSIASGTSRIRSGLSESYTADEMASGRNTFMSGVSSPPPPSSGSPGSGDREDSELLRAVMNASTLTAPGPGTPLPNEIPPMYHTIQQDSNQAR